MESRSRVSKWLVPIMLLAISCSKPPEKPQEPPPRDNSIACLGHVEPVDGISKIAARSLSGQPSIIGRLMVDDGDTVKKGDLIAVLDSSQQLERAWRAAESQIRVSETRLAQAKAGAKISDVAAQQAEIARLEAEVANARIERARAEKLNESGVTSTSVLDQRRLAEQRLDQSLAQAKERLKSLDEVRQVDVDLAEAQLAAARTEAARARAEYENTKIFSPIDGRVVKVVARAGEEVTGGQGIVELANTDRMYVIAEIPESEVARVKVGQRATITGDALTGTVNGVVHKLEMKVAKNREFAVEPSAFADARVLEVKILVDNPKAVADLIDAQVTAVITP
jgi:HlyD family secretion protein